jgi:hypothetical protein
VETGVEGDPDVVAHAHVVRQLKAWIDTLDQEDAYRLHRDWAKTLKAPTSSRTKNVYSPPIVSRQDAEIDDTPIEAR